MPLFITIMVIFLRYQTDHLNEQLLQKEQRGVSQLPSQLWRTVEARCQNKKTPPTEAVTPSITKKKKKCWEEEWMCSCSCACTAVLSQSRSYQCARAKTKTRQPEANTHASADKQRRAQWWVSVEQRTIRSAAILMNVWIFLSIKYDIIHHYHENKSEVAALRTDTWKDTVLNHLTIIKRLVDWL